MATVTGLTAARMLEIEAATIIGGEISNTGQFTLDKHDGTQINVGTLASIVLPTDQFVEATESSSYPVGVSLMNVEIAGWTPYSYKGTVVTNRVLSARTQQTFYVESTTLAGTVLAFVRTWTTAGAGNWTPWRQMLVANDLDVSTFTQSSALSAYPPGQSRLYFSTGTASNGWDFAGKIGEVITYRDGTDFARQTWTRHFGGATNLTETWVRTANAASGWCKWLVVAEDTGWINISVSGGHTQQIQAAHRRRNGIVYLKGAFTAPFSGTPNYTTACTLPTGFRPAENKIFPASGNTQTTMSFQVNSSGTVATWTSASTTSWLSIAGASFPID